MTSLKSWAQAALERASGPGVRNCEDDSMTKGVTPPTHGVGSLGRPAIGHQCPFSMFGFHCEGPKRPSSSRAVIMASAAAFPAAIP